MKKPKINSAPHYSQPLLLLCIMLTIPFIVGIICFLLEQIGIILQKDIKDPSIPIILSASCDYWVDQNGDTMTIEEADAFFNRNPVIGCKIVFDNLNDLYATRLYSAEREAWLEEKFKNGFAHMDDSTVTDAITDDDLYDIYRRVLARTPPSDDTLSLLEIHLAGNVAAQYVANIQRDITNPDLLGPRYTDNNGEHLFLACLATFTENGLVDDLCSNAPSTNQYIPIIVNQDGEWYDQYCNPLDNVAVAEFFDGHPEQANVINSLNLTVNPLIDPENLPADSLSEMTSYISRCKTNIGDHELCTGILNEMTANPVKASSLEEISQLIQAQPSNDYQNTWTISETLAIVDELKIKYGDLDQVQACQQYGYNLNDGWLIRYVFVNTLAEFNEIHNFQQS